MRPGNGDCPKRHAFQAVDVSCARKHKTTNIDHDWIGRELLPYPSLTVGLERHHADEVESVVGRRRFE